jgi:hypothetical protein
MLYDPNWQPPADIKLKPWQEVLLKAADIIEQKGWTQGEFQKSGRHCAVGAINMATGGTPLSARQPEIAYQATHMLLKFLNETTLEGSRIGSVMSWNDSYAKTRKEILKAFRGAAHAV